MPSDPRVAHALAALAHPIADFRALVEGALAQSDAFLRAQSADVADVTMRARVELGQFADGRIDATSFGRLFPRAAPADATSLAALNSAVATLRSVSTRGERLFTIEVPPGDRLDEIVNAGLANAGRAFGAVIVAELVRGGRYI